MITRRLCLLGLAGVLSSCGFHPVYESGTTQSAALAAIYVKIIPNRNGQLLRQALQTRLEGPDGDVAKRFELSISYQQTLHPLGVQADNSTTRNRDIGVAKWALYPVGDDTRTIASGTVRSLDGYDIIDEQFFYSDLSEEATEKRLADLLADQIVLNLALYFRKHPEKN